MNDENSKVEVTAIIEVTFRGTSVELTADEARDLMNALSRVLGDESRVLGDESPPSPSQPLTQPDFFQPYPYPEYPYSPFTC